MVEQAFNFISLPVHEDIHPSHHAVDLKINSKDLVFDVKLSYKQKEGFIPFFRKEKSFKNFKAKGSLRLVLSSTLFT